MNKIFYYELKRTLNDKLFWLIFGITSIYACQIFVTDILEGISYTAPFSSWSYGFFLSKIVPFICIACFLRVSKNYGKKETENVRLIYTKNKYTKNYMNVKLCANLTAMIIILICLVLLSFIFYASIFHFFKFGDYISIILFTTIPPLIFTLGISYVLFRINPRIAVIAMCSFFFLEILGIEEKIDIFGGIFFKQTPLLFEQTPEFFFSKSFLQTRIILLGIGLICFIIHPILLKKVEND